MAVLGQNNCTPARIFGPLRQTIFCGCSVQSFNVSAGWNEQPSQLTVNLVYDDCAGQRVWWDSSLTRQTSDNTADPGFTYPEPGCAAYFRMEEDPDGATEADRGGFEYAGIVESWNEKFDANGNPVYVVKLSDPRTVLQNAQVIVNEFPGGTSGVYNLINAYGYVETFGSECTTSEAGAFGGFTATNTAQNITNDRGMVWNDVKCAVQTLTSAVDTVLVGQYNNYCRDNRLVFTGPTTAGYGVMASDGNLGGNFVTIPNATLAKHEYLVDLTEIPFAPTSYRISGPTISLAELVSQVCKDAGCDYYVELLPVKNGGKVLKVIKIRVAVRSSQPVLGIVDDFIAAKQAQATNAGGGVLSHVAGAEVRNEETSIYLMGGKVRNMYTVDNTQMLPYWGLDTDGNLIQATINGTEYEVRLDLGRLNTTLYTPFSSQYKWITETELRVAAGGDVDAWKAVTKAKNGDFQTHLTTIKQTSNLNLDALDDAMNGQVPGVAAVGAMNDANDTDQDAASNSAKDLDKIFEFVSNYANDFYGKQFIVNAPFVCFSTDIESDTLKFSHLPSTEGGWLDDSETTILGLAHQSAASDFFRDEQGKYQVIVRYPLTGASTMGGGGGSLVVDPTKIGEDNYISDNSTSVWVKGDVNPQWLAGTPLQPSASTISFIITIDNPVLNRTSKNDDLTEGMSGLDAAVNDSGGGLASATVEAQDKGIVTLSAINEAIAPNGATVPTLWNIDVYGPWGVAGLPGQVIAEYDEGFVPWEYGSDVVMYQAAVERVAQAVTQMRKGERGSVTVAGFPNIPIGAELYSVDSNSPPFSMGGQKYVGSRFYNTSVCADLAYIYVQMNAWSGLYGPNITNVTCNVGANGFTTTYEFSTYTPQFGRFTKGNAEMLKRVGQDRLAAQRNNRAQALLKSQIQASLGGGSRGGRNALNNKQQGRAARQPNGAASIFVSRSAGGRNEVLNLGAKEAAMASSTDAIYQNTAYMSLDGLLRPVSKAGDGGFSPFITPGTTQCSELPDQPISVDPPIKAYTRLEVSQTYLDPLANPNDTVITARSDVAASGHDIEVLGRGTAGPRTSFAIRESEAAADNGYNSDYRFMALRGPIVIQQWGYDLDGKPVPNKADTDANAEAGNFTTTALEDKFLDAWLRKPKTWPVAQLDLRLDRERGLWTVPMPPRNLHVTNEEPCILTSKNSTVDNGKTVYDDAGATVGTKEVDVEWPWTIAPPTGIGKFPIYWDNYDCEHYAFPINRLDVAKDEGTTYRDVKLITFDRGFDIGGFSIGGGCGNEVTISYTGDGGGGSDCQSFVRGGVCIGGELGSQQSGCVDVIKFGLPLTTTIAGGIATVDWNNIIYASGDCFDTNPSTPISNWKNLRFGYGFTTHLGIDECEAVINYNNYISADGKCRPLGRDAEQLGSDGIDFVGSGGLTRKPFQALRFGRGLFVTEYEEDCEYIIKGGIYINGNTSPCFDEGGAGVDSGYLYEGIVLGTGIYSETVSGCLAEISAGIVQVYGCSAGYGDGFTTDKYGTSGTGPTLSCTDPVCEGPYVGIAGNERKPPKEVRGLAAGAGIGFASCSDCDLIIYNATWVQGKTSTGTNGCGDDRTYAQVWYWEIGNGLIVEDTVNNSGGQVRKGSSGSELSDKSLGVKVSIGLENTSTTREVVSNITVDADGHVTEVECCTFSFQKICGLTAYVLNTIPDCNCSASGGTGTGGAG